jgi:hypothetical protein
MPIHRPIFVLGLPRTGTTALHHLLGQDPSTQVLEYWIAASPGPRPPREAWASDPRFKQAERELKMTYWLDPGLKRSIDDRRRAESVVTCSRRRSPTTPSTATRRFLRTRVGIPRATCADLPPHRRLLQLIGSTSPDRR